MARLISQIMKERDDSNPLSGVIQGDDIYWGGEHRGGKTGRGFEKNIFAAAALNENGHPI